MSEIDLLKLMKEADTTDKPAVNESYKEYTVTLVLSAMAELDAQAVRDEIENLIAKNPNSGLEVLDIKISEGKVPDLTKDNIPGTIKDLIEKKKAIKEAAEKLLLVKHLKEAKREMTEKEKAFIAETEKIVIPESDKVEVMKEFRLLKEMAATPDSAQAKKARLQAAIADAKRQSDADAIRDLEAELAEVEAQIKQGAK